MPYELGVLTWMLYTPGDSQRPCGVSAGSLGQVSSLSGHSWLSSLYASTPRATRPLASHIVKTEHMSCFLWAWPRGL